MGDYIDTSKPYSRDLTNEEISEIALFRYWQRRFLKASEEVAHALGVEFGQYQVLLAILAASWKQPVTLTRLAHLLLLELHSTVEMVDRLEARGLVYREQDRVDLRQRFVQVTAEGEALVRRGVRLSVRVIQEVGPSVDEVVSRILAWQE